MKTAVLTEHKEVLGPIETDDTEWCHKLVTPLPVGEKGIALCGCECWAWADNEVVQSKCRVCPDCLRINGGPWT